MLPLYNRDAGFKYTESPNPDWKYGESIDVTLLGKEWAEGEKMGWKHVDPATENPMALYQLMTSGIVPRPIAFVSTISHDGVENLAPFSWFNMVTHDPPTISISCSNGPERMKDTTNNIKSGNGFTVNIISVPFAEQANVCSINAPDNFSEWAVSGLTKEPSFHVKAARVKESAFSMECELFQIVDIVNPVTEIATTTLILGLVKHIHVRNDVLTERGTVDPTKFKPLGRLGGTCYSTLGDGFRLPRPAWQNEQKNVEEALKKKADVKDT